MSKKILVVVDMQKDFVDGALGTKEAVAIVPKVCEAIRDFDGDIIVTMDTHSDDYLDTQEGKYLPVKHCIKDSEGWQLDKDVAKALEERGSEFAVYEKPTFGSVDLANDLQLINDTEGIEEITFMGLCTGICVISNVMMAKAFMTEVPVRVDASCSACVTPESHKNAIEAMKLCQVIIENE